MATNKWADYLISEVRFNDAHTHINKVKVHVDKGDTVGGAVEMKRLKGSVTSPEQKAWIEALSLAGIPSKICKGYEQAVQFIESIK